MIGSRIAFLRRRHSMTQEDLAERLAVSPAAVGAYEQGRRTPSASMLVELSGVLGVSTDFLLTGRPGGYEEMGTAAAYSLQHRSEGKKDSRHVLALQMLLMLTDDQKLE